MEEELKPFQVRGTKDNPEPVEAGDILEAIAEGRDIDIEYADITGMTPIAATIHPNRFVRPIALPTRMNCKGTNPL